LKASAAQSLFAGLELGPEFLATKIAPPHVPHRGLARTRLLTRIGVPPTRRLVLVYAPAGFGKSSFLAAWTRELSDLGIRPAWLSVDPHDVDLHHFLGYVAAALNAAEPAIGSDVIELVGRRGRSVQPTLLVHLLLDSIAAQQGPVVLVIDDYHAAAGSAIDEALSELVLHAPSNLHLVIAGRGAPPLRLGRLRAAEQVLELGPEDLAFDTDEVRSFFVQTSGCNISAQEVAQLQAFSEGWPACLQMAAISMRRKQNVARVLHAPRSPGREIASYLREDVLQGIEPELHSFLMRTAILDRFNSALAGAVTGVSNSRALIEAIERRQLFLVPLDDRGEWFRYHPLFGNCLREELERTHAAEVPSLHLRACDWLAGNELWGEAVLHATAAGHPERALAIVEGCAMDFVRRGDFLTLTELLRRFPDEAWQRSIGLQIAYAWALAYSGGNTDEAAGILLAVEARLPLLASAEQRAIATQILLIRLTILSFQDDTGGCRVLLDSVDPTLPEQDAFASDIVNTCAAFVQVCSGHSREAREYLPCLYPMKRVYQQIVIALSWQREGRPVDAEREIARAQELALGEFGERSISNLLCLAALAPLQYERGEFATIERGLGSRLPMLDEIAPTDVLVTGYAAVAWTRAASGMFAEAESLLAHLQALAAARRWQRAEACALLELLRLRIARGAHAFDDLAARMQEIASLELPAQMSTRWDAIQCARLGAAACQSLGSVDPRALVALNSIVEEIDARAGIPLAVKAHLLLAHAFSVRGDTARAREAMAATLEHARRAHMLRTVRESGAWAQDLVDRIEAASGGLPVRARAAMGEGPGTAPAAGASVELSAREQEILGLVGRGLSNKVIGKTLQIAPETVKWHIKNLFAKLGVANRIQAVNRARTHSQA
jgi:LuxR family maltose regulon positive regulatory protein